MPTYLDANGNPLASTPAKTYLDANGEPIKAAPATDAPQADTRSLYQKAKDNFNANTQGAKPGDGAVKGFIENIGQGGGQTIRALAHPLDTLSGMASAVAHPQATADAEVDALRSDPSRFIGNAIGQYGAGAILGEAVKEAMPVAKTATAAAATTVGDAAQDAGTGLINKTIGTLKNDFKRGANPGRGYLETGGGPAMSMQSIAETASAAKETIGKALGDAYAKASVAGTKIPVDVVAKEMAKPLQKAIDLATGPGGTGDTATIHNYIQQFEPTFAKAAENGGFTPAELFDMKQSIAKNTNWSDPAQFSLKTVRQQQTGALSGILSDAVPETSELNQHFQDLTKLTNRATERANTGSRPLTAHIYKAGMAAVGTAAGALDHNALLGLAAGTVADSVPFKTTLATGLYRGGKAISAIGDRLTPADSAAVEDISPNDLGNNGSGNEGANPQGTSPQLTAGLPQLPANSNANPSQPIQQPQLSAPPKISQLPGGPQGWRLSSASAVPTPAPPSPPPPLNADTARMRVQPLQPSRPTVIPPRGSIAVSPSGEATLPAKGLPAPEATAKPLTGKALWAERGTQNLAAHGVSADDLQNLTKTAKGKDLLVIASGLTPGSAAMKNLVKQANKLLNP